MKLTPLDVRKQEFKRIMRGYDPVEVDTFLDMGRTVRLALATQALQRLFHTSATRSPAVSVLEVGVAVGLSLLLLGHMRGEFPVRALPLLGGVPVRRGLHPSQEGERHQGRDGSRPPRRR